MRIRWMTASLMLLLAAASCRRPAPNLKIDPALSILVPPDAKFLLGAKAEQIRSTEAYRKYSARFQSPLDEFTRRTGLDPRKDIWEMLAAGNERDVVVMVRGKFAPSGLEPELEKSGAKRFSYKSYSLIGTEDAALVFMNSTTAVAGKAADLRAMIDRRNSGGGAAPALLGRTTSIPSAVQIWGVAAGPFSPGRLPVSPRGSLAVPFDMLNTITAVTAWVDLRTQADVNIEVAAASSEDAKRLHDALRGLIGMGRLSTPDGRTDLLRFYDSIQVEQSGAAVRLHLAASFDLLDQAAASVPQFPGRVRP